MPMFFGLGFFLVWLVKLCKRGPTDWFIYALNINYIATKHEVKRRMCKISIQVSFPVSSLLFLAKCPAFHIKTRSEDDIPIEQSVFLFSSLSFDPPLFCSKKAMSYFQGKEEGVFNTVLPFILQKTALVAGKGARNVRIYSRKDKSKAKYGHGRLGYSTQAGRWQALAQRTQTRHGRNVKFCWVLSQI